jgi:hypothetical protein
MEKHVGFAQQNGFHRTFFHMMLKLIKGTTKPNTINWLNNLSGLGVIPNTCQLARYIV